MSNQNTKETLQIIAGLKGNFDKLLKVQQKLINDLPTEYREKVNFVNKDISIIKKAVANGNLDQLNELTKRYADTNNTD